ncbi:MAG: hypothetical protein Q8T03_03125 [Bacteroidota bacterium]|nr:hypothetical protein [Bacteroidota bacterium]
MKVIGDRISIFKKDNLLSIVILPTVDKKKLMILFLWLFAWTVCGLIVLISYFKMYDKDTRVFMLIYLSFWAYFEFKIARAFIWKKKGKEKIWIKDGVINYQRELNKKSKIREYNISLLDDFKIIDLNNTSFADTINQSFWIKGGERLEFISQGKSTPFAMQITDTEAKALYNEISKFLLERKQ